MEVTLPVSRGSYSREGVERVVRISLKEVENVGQAESK